MSKNIIINSLTSEVVTPDFSFLEQKTPYQGDMIFKLDGMSAEEYIAKLTEEMNFIDFCSIPFDKWDYIVTFALAIMEVAGDFFICDPKYKNSIASTLSDKNSKLGEWLNSLHDKWDHAGQPIDYQGPNFAGGNHRGNTLGHDLLMFPLALYMLYNGQFIDNTFSKDGIYKWIVTNTNQNGTLYEGLNAGETIIAYFTHMAADFCSSRSIPIPGFSILTHFPDRDVQTFAMKLYKDGLNIRNLLLQGVPVAFTELAMRIYIGLRYKDSDYSQEAITHKQEKLLLIAHGIATAVNVGKVVITKNPVSLNLVMIARTFYLIWKVSVDEMRLTNKAKEKLNLGVMKAQIESMQTMVLLDKTIYMTDQVDRLIAQSKSNIEDSRNKQKNIIFALDNDCKEMLAKLQ